MGSKIVLDDKRRGSFGPDFDPGDTFVREVSGDMITFRKLAPAEPKLVRARKVNGRWMGANINITKEDILAAIRADRESR